MNRHDHHPTWTQCGTCWGQGRLHRRIEDGLVAVVCEGCLGVGARVTEPAVERLGAEAARLGALPE
jgi:hypothetical protein